MSLQMHQPWKLLSEIEIRTQTGWHRVNTLPGTVLEDSPLVCALSRPGGPCKNLHTSPRRCSPGMWEHPYTGTPSVLGVIYLWGYNGGAEIALLSRSADKVPPDCKFRKERNCINPYPLISPVRWLVELNHYF